MATVSIIFSVFLCCHPNPIPNLFVHGTFNEKESRVKKLVCKLWDRSEYMTVVIHTGVFADRLDSTDSVRGKDSMRLAEIVLDRGKVYHVLEDCKRIYKIKGVICVRNRF